MLYFWKAWDSRISNMTFPFIKCEIHKYKNTKCLEDPTCAISSCPEQLKLSLNRWPCHWLSHWVTFDFDILNFPKISFFFENLKIFRKSQFFWKSQNLPKIFVKKKPWKRPNWCARFTCVTVLLLVLLYY